MSMSDLITLAEYKQFDTNTPSTDDTLLGNLITGATDVIERHTNRTFQQASYDDVYDGNGLRLLILDHFPIISIDSIRSTPLNVMTVQNTSTAVSRATVRVTTTGVTLTSVTSAVTSTTPLLFATYTTLTALATAIGAVSGWTATVTTNYETYSSADLRAVQGSLNAKLTPAWLILHSQDINDFRVEEDTGVIDYPYVFHRGSGNWRVIYTANFAVVPESIKQACRELVHASYSSRRLDPGLVTQKLGTWDWTKVVDASFGNLSLPSREALARYRSVRVPRFKSELSWRR